MHLTVFGATGRTGRPLVSQALAAGHEVTAFVRDPGKVDRDHENLRVVAGDAYTGEGVAEAVEGADAVVSVLGQTDGSPDDLLTVAGDHILAAMDGAGVGRFVTLVGAGVRHERDSVSLGGRVMNTALKLLAGEVLADAREHVERVRGTDLAWTVVRPPRLTEGEHTGEYRTGYLSLGMGDTVSRADVADFILRVVEEDAHVGEMPMVAG
jgi:putative NADH-flavin reductase